MLIITIYIYNHIPIILFPALESHFSCLPLLLHQCFTILINLVFISGLIFVSVTLSAVDLLTLFTLWSSHILLFGILYSALNLYIGVCVACLLTLINVCRTQSIYLSLSLGFDLYLVLFVSFVSLLLLKSLLY